MTFYFQAETLLFKCFPGRLGGRGMKRDAGPAVAWLSEEDTDLSIFCLQCSWLVFPLTRPYYMYKDVHYILMKHISEEN